MGQSVIQERYGNSDYFYYPEMEKILNDLIENPETEIIIPNDFINKSLDNKGFLLDALQKVKILFHKVMTNIKYFFSSSYRKSYKLAVSKIDLAYQKKIASIVKFSGAIKNASESIEKDKKEVISLKGRIKILEEEMEMNRIDLEEKINTKNLVVSLAKSLKIKREREITVLEKIDSFFTSLFFEVPVQDIESDEIIVLDKTFQVHELTDKNISDYENDEYEISPLIQEIKKKKLDWLVKENLLKTEQQRLETIRALLNDAVKNIQKDVHEVKRLNLEDFFSDVDLEIPDIKEDIASAVSLKELSPKENQLKIIKDDIAKYGNKDLATLFTLLLNRFTEDAISAWQCDDTGQFILKFKEVSKIWVPGNDPVGGAILMFGYEQNGEVKGHLSKDTILFQKGANSFVKAPIVGYVAPTFDAIQYHSRTDIRMRGSHKGFTQERQKPFSQIRKDWENEGELVEGDCQKFLAEKIRLLS